MQKSREVFLEKQMSIYKSLIKELENSKMNQKEKKDLLNIKELYNKYLDEYKALEAEKIS